jgi:outer membrane protein OmpA-like peptidoglycan-associated protein
MPQDDYMMPLPRPLLFLLIALCLSPSALCAQAAISELPGARDHSLVSRFAGSVLQNAADERFASVRVPAGPGRTGDGGLVFGNATTVEGHVSAFFYVAPKERSALEVFRNYQTALKGAGFAMLYTCEMQACDSARIREPFSRELLGSRKWVASRTDPTGSFDRDVRFISAKVSRDGKDAYVLVYVAEPNSLWQAPVAAVVIAEPTPMETGNVVVSTDLLRKGLADNGKIALYGIYFDTARAELKPESKPQLEEMARLLTSDKSLKVLIVGHTDNQGTVDGNLALSQRRADAVVAALVSGYAIDAARLRARGVANFAPVATNRTEAGRAKNRRVELVEQ